MQRCETLLGVGFTVGRGERQLVVVAVSLSAAGVSLDTSEQPVAFLHRVMKNFVLIHPPTCRIRAKTKSFCLVTSDLTLTNPSLMLANTS